MKGNAPSQFALIIVILVTTLSAEAQNDRPASATYERIPQQEALTELDTLAQQAHEQGNIQKEIELRNELSEEAWIHYQQHPTDPGRWNRWAIVDENDLPLARLLDGSHQWAKAETVYRHNQSSLKHERLAGNDIKSENDLHLARLLTKEGNHSEANSICNHWKSRVKHNADFARNAIKYDVPTPPLYDTPEVGVATWTLACGPPEDGLAMLRQQIDAHPGMLAPFTALAAYYTTNGDFERALAIENNGTSALLATPNASRK